MIPPTKPNHFKSIANLARFIDASQSAEEMYAHFTQGVCQHSVWDISSLQVLDIKAGLTLPIYRYDPFNLGAETDFPSWDANKSPIGTVLHEGVPIVLADAAAQDDYPSFRDDAINRGYHTVVITPLRVRDSVHRPMVYTVASRRHYQLQDGDMEFLQCVSELMTLAIQKIQKLQRQKQETERMRNILERTTASLTKVLDQEAADTLASELSGLLPAGWLAVDLTTGRSFYDSDRPPPFALHTSQRIPEALIAAALKPHDLFQGTPIALTFQESPISAEVRALQVDGTHVGALFFFDRGMLSDHEHIAAQVGQLALSSFIMRGFIEFKSRRMTAHRLLEKLFNKEWRNIKELQHEGNRLNFDLTIPCRVLIVQVPHEEDIRGSLHSFIQRSTQSIFGSAISCIAGRSLIILTHDDTKEITEKQNRFLDHIQPFLPSGTLLTASDLCTDVENLPRAREVCENTLKLASSMKVSGWVIPQDIGEFSMLMAAVDTGRADIFLSNVLTKVLGQKNRKGDIARETVRVFLQTGRKYQEAADKLGIHVSTLRYRLDQISQHVGVDFHDPDRCFELEVAIKLYKIQNSYEK